MAVTIPRSWLYAYINQTCLEGLSYHWCEVVLLYEYRKPPKKSLTKKRFWEEVYLRLEDDDKGIPCILLYRHEKDAKKGRITELIILSQVE